MPDVAETVSAGDGRVGSGENFDRRYPRWADYRGRRNSAYPGTYVRTCPTYFC